MEDDGITQKIEERDKQMEKQGRKGKKVQYKEANIQITGTLKRKSRKKRGENHQQNNFNKSPRTNELQFPN